MEKYVTYAQLCRIGYVARRFGAPWVIPDDMKMKARKSNDEAFAHRRMAGAGEWSFCGSALSILSDQNGEGKDVDDEDEEDEDEEKKKIALEVEKKELLLSGKAFKEEEKVEVHENVESGTRWFYWSGSKNHPWLGPEIHSKFAFTQKLRMAEKQKRDRQIEKLAKEKRALEEKKTLSKGGKWPTFDVWRPNGNFKKSGPGEPDFRIAVTSDRPPHGDEAEILWRRSKNVKLKIANVESGAIMLFDLDAGLAR